MNLCFVPMSHCGSGLWSENDMDQMLGSNGSSCLDKSYLMQLWLKRVVAKSSGIVVVFFFFLLSTLNICHCWWIWENWETDHAVNEKDLDPLRTTKQRSEKTMMVIWNKKAHFFPQKNKERTCSLSVVSPHQQVVYWSPLWKKIMMTTLKCEERTEFFLSLVSHLVLCCRKLLQRLQLLTESQMTAWKIERKKKRKRKNERKFLFVNDPTYFQIC